MNNCLDYIIEKNIFFVTEEQLSMRSSRIISWKSFISQLIALQKKETAQRADFFCQISIFLSPDPSVFVLAAEKPPLLYRGTPHLDQIDSHQFGLVLFQHAFFAVYPAYPTTNGCRFRHRIIYPFFCACPGFPLLFCFSFVFANFRLEFEFQVQLR